MGESKDTISKVIDEFRRRDGTRLREQFDSGNIRAGSRHSFGVDESDDFVLE
jgi:glutathione-regulated potassium-efflux system protein KefB